ncbi:MAG: flagellar protein FliS [Ignavibacteriota bacterium]
MATPGVTWQRATSWRGHVHFEGLRYSDRTQHLLDYERGGELSVRLSQLYGYMHRRLVEANFQQADAPLAEVASLLNTLMEGWSGVKAGLQHDTPRETPWMQGAFPELETTGASCSWSF